MKKEPVIRKSFLDFLSAIKSNKPHQQSNRQLLNQLSRPAVREELSIKGVAVLSDN